MNKERLALLCDLDGTSGNEHAVRDCILSQLDRCPTEKTVTVDAMGNVLVHLKGKKEGTVRLLLDAHMDEVGVIVTYITEDGFLLFDTVGGIDPQSLFGKRIRFGKTHGVIGGKAVHQCDKDERDTLPTAEKMCIDIGATDRQGAEKLIRLGDVGVFDTAFTAFGENRFMGKAVDDRFGCAVLLELAEKRPPMDVWLSFSVQEEVGARGAKTVAEQIKPDIAISLDATTAADTVGNSERQSVCSLGKGAVVYYADRGTLYDNDLYRMLWDLASENGIPVQTKNKIAGGTNASSIQRSGTGVRMAGLSLPCRYIHSPQCVGDWDDVQAIEDLLQVFIERLAYDR